MSAKLVLELLGTGWYGWQGESWLQAYLRHDTRGNFRKAISDKSIKTGLILKKGGKIGVTVGRHGAWA